MKTKFVYGWMLLGLLIFMVSMSDSHLAFSAESEKANTAITPLPGVPKDFELVYGSGAAHADWGRTKYTISADGVLIVERTKNIREEDQNPEIKQCQLTAEELRGLWKEVQEVNFFKLKENYTNPHIMDGSSNFIYVKADGKEHTVSVMNTEVKAFDRIADDIEQMFDKKVSK